MPDPTDTTPDGLTAEQIELLDGLRKSPLEVFDEKQAAEYLGVGACTLRHRRCGYGYAKGSGPRFAKLPGARAVRYLRRWLIEYVETGEQTPTLSHSIDRVRRAVPDLAGKLPAWDKVPVLEALEDLDEAVAELAANDDNDEDEAAA